MSRLPHPDRRFVSGFRVMAVCAAGAAMFAGPTTTHAQIAASQGGGRALDANQQVGSGGDNRIENQVDYSARNDLVTGNVAGGFGFQDSVGYSAPGAFQGGLQSESLFSFQAASLGSAPLVANLPGNVRRGGNVVVYNNFTTIPQNRQVNSPTTFAPQGGVFRVSRDLGDANAYQLSLDQNPNNLINNRYAAEPGTNTLGVLRVEDGSALAVTADPLRGVRRRALTPTPGSVPPTNAGDPSMIPGLDPETGLPSFDGEPQNNYVPATALDGSSRLTQGPADNAELAARQRASFTDAAGMVKPTLQLGQLATNPAQASPAAIEQRVKSLQEEIFGPTTTPAPGTAPETTPPGTAADQAGPRKPADSYTQLLDEIREQSRQSVAERQAADEAAGVDNRPEWMRALRDPSSQELDAAEGSLAATMERIRASVDENRRRDGRDQQGRQNDAEAQAQADAALDDLMTDLSYNIRLETLVAEREGRLNELFAQAETQMASGQFLNAERTYRQIRIEAADNPLGQSGLVHAQIGAGMVRSAAFNLRQLFEDHPELIATRYGKSLLPPGDRLEWVQKELQRMIDAESNALEPGLMMAYLGYQVESRQLIRYGLAIAEEASPLDPLLPVLRRIWLDQKPAEATDDSK